MIYAVLVLDQECLVHPVLPVPLLRMRMERVCLPVHQVQVSHGCQWCPNPYNVCKMFSVSWLNFFGQCVTVLPCFYSGYSLNSLNGHANKNACLESYEGSVEQELITI